MVVAWIALTEAITAIYARYNTAYYVDILAAMSNVHILSRIR